MSYHKLTKRLEKLEKKYPSYVIIASNKGEVITTEKGTKELHRMLNKLGRIYSYVNGLVDYNPAREEILKIIEE